MTRPSTSRRAVVIDDQREFCDWFADQVRALDCEVEVAYDGLTGLELVQQLLPEIVFIDIVLPGINGWELARRVRRLDLARMPRLIAVSAMRDSAHRNRSIALGFEDHLVKPFNPAVLVDLLARQ